MLSDADREEPVEADYICVSGRREEHIPELSAE